MAHAWGTTAEVCKVIGSSVNVKKTCCPVAFDPHNHPPGRPHSLRKVKLVKTFRYLGADISLSGTAMRPTAAKRCASFIQRCALILSVHFSQRGILLADASAALWMVAGSLFSMAQLRRMNATGAIGQFSNRVTQAIRSGSRNMIHVSGPGAHFTHAGCSAVYISIRQWLRMRTRPRDMYHVTTARGNSLRNTVRELPDRTSGVHTAQLWHSGWLLGLCSQCHNCAV